MNVTNGKKRPEPCFIVTGEGVGSCSKQINKNKHVCPYSLAGNTVKDEGGIMQLRQGRLLESIVMKSLLGDTVLVQKEREWERWRQRERK